MLRRLAPDFVGSIQNTSARKKQDSFFAALTDFSSPCKIACYDFKEKKEEKRWRTYRSAKLAGLRASEFSAELTEYTSHDKKKIPMFVVRHENTPLDGTAPAFQYGECTTNTFTTDSSLFLIL